PAGLALVAYGGAGPLHATALARELGCPAVVVPPAPGVLSALGLLLAPPRFEASRTVLADAGDDLSRVQAELAEEARQELEKQHVTTAITLSGVADMRYAGQSHELRVDLTEGSDPAELFHAAHRESYGYEIRDERVEVVTLRVVARGEPVLAAPPGDWDQGSPEPRPDREIGVGDQTVRARVVPRAALRPGDAITGPALVEQPDTTTLLGEGEVAVVDDAENLVVRWT
ncbi:hydantoinase/oxoprolinase family protein, partial [Saccharopolyspora hordei]